MGNMYRRLGRIEEAQKSFRAAFDLSKDGVIQKAARESSISLEKR
jgi:predicted RNA polymerase sigma factor